MRHRVHTFKIGRTSSHRKAMLANMISSLIQNGSVKTTVAKAKEARRFADRMVTLGKKGTLHHRRQAVSFLRDKIAVKKLFNDIAPTFLERNGGYTRIMLLGARRGDGAEMCILQLTNNDEVKQDRGTTDIPRPEQLYPEKEEAKAETPEEEAETPEEEAETPEEEAETPEEEAETPKEVEEDAPEKDKAEA